MASVSLRRFDVQAKLSLATSLMAAVGLGALVYLIFRNYERELGAIVFKASGRFPMIFLLACAGTMLLSVVGMALGISSAGERRNEFQRRSWTGFFIGTAVLSGAIICLAGYHFLQLKFQ